MYKVVSRGWRKALAGTACALLLASCSGKELPRATVLPPPPTQPEPTQEEPGNPACQDPRDPGRVTLHRLNRAEYDNTVRDLLGDTTRPARDFPADDHGYGFDNNADVLSLGPLLMEKYSAAAEKLVEASWTRVRTCTPDLADPLPCAHLILERFAHRAWRRPITPAEVDRLLAFLPLARAHGDGFDAGMKLALRAVLLSPHFLYRVELDADPTSTTPHPLNDHELASRLSYFLWSSMPDEALMATADAGTLRTPEELERQVRRMLADPKAEALVDNFAGQWLYTRALDTFHPDPLLYPFDDSLREAMRQETRLVFREFLLGNHPASKLLDADFTYVNDRLAQHYGLPSPGTSQMTRVDLSGHPERAGLFGQGSILAVTSHPDRTSPVKRGLWVLEQLLCKAPPPPPPNVEGLPPPVDPTMGIKQRMAQHSSDPTCSGCHQMMDPIGYGLENFNVVGAWRQKEEVSGARVDPSGELPGGLHFKDGVELRTLLQSDPALDRCIAQHLLTYGLGRGPTQADACTLEDVTKKAGVGGGRLSDLILSLTRSEAFTHRRGEAPSSDVEGSR
ncbi:DUF1592 domain-containing protein [Archangium lansingense]|uniref:DUF1592 domain-containing protein n=1 Tax=Archangium lansingense TaxID=2995310 RepID=A0ABT4ANI2_9BACT|nr:DUF1592 domain-containing protein [Archangium lansinium]MCY1082729.1 DUF1592 domain-containing protein [Archangium lansinium]